MKMVKGERLKMKSEHTKGEWRIVHGDIHEIPSADRHSCIAEVSKTSFWPEAEANAHLIAAAPDLLAACKRAKQIISEFQQVIKTVNEAKTKFGFNPCVAPNPPIDFLEQAITKAIKKSSKNP